MHSLIKTHHILTVWLFQVIKYIWNACSYNCKPLTFHTYYYYYYYYYIHLIAFCPGQPR